MTYHTPKRRCPHCHTLYTLGVNGVVGGCDKCLRISRDLSGYVWQQSESNQTRQDLTTGEIFTVARAVAFGE